MNKSQLFITRDTQISMGTKQKMLFPNIQVSLNRTAIQRTRKMCVWWNRKTNFSYCELDKNKHCRPAVCLQFEMRKEIRI